MILLIAIGVLLAVGLAVKFVVPAIARHRMDSRAVTGELADQVEDVAHEAGVRRTT